MVPNRVRVISYLKSLYELATKHHLNLLPFEEIVERHNVCLTCPKLEGKTCLVCGCNCNTKGSYFNKLAFPNERCPDNPPRWVEKKET